MVRLIVTSRAYQQSSIPTKQQLERDPENRWIARQTPFRMEAELIRDNALTVAGLLVHRVGGPSTKPYQPEGYWENLNFPTRTYHADRNADQYRRGLYIWWQRSFLHPSLLAFDAPSREECVADRARSNIPQQALVLLNDPTYVEAARGFAVRILEVEGSDHDRIHWAFQKALQRNPSPEETRLLKSLLDQQLEHYQEQKEAPAKLLSIGLHPMPPNIDPVRVAAWFHVARVLLNLHESITRS